MRAADRVVRLTPGAVKKAARDMTDDELADIDADLAHRAAALGQPGRLSKAHAAIRAEIDGR